MLLQPLKDHICSLFNPKGRCFVIPLEPPDLSRGLAELSSASLSIAAPEGYGPAVGSVLSSSFMGCSFVGKCREWERVVPVGCFLRSLPP